MLRRPLRSLAPIALTLSLLLVTPAVAATTPREKRAVRDLASQLDRVDEQVTAAGRQWCGDGELSGTVDRLASDVIDLVDRLRGKAKPNPWVRQRTPGGTWARYLVWGPESYDSTPSMETRATDLQEGLERCRRREVAIAGSAGALAVAGSDPADALLRLERSTAAWRDGDGRGPLPGKNEACAAIEGARLRVPQGTWRELDLEALRLGLDLDTSELCRQARPDAVARAEATEWTVTRLREAEESARAGRWGEAQQLLDSLRRRWREASAVDIAEAEALAEELEVAMHQDRLGRAESAVRAAEAEPTTDVFWEAVNRIRLLGPGFEQEQAALTARLLGLEPGWVATLRAQLDGIEEPDPMLVLRQEMLGIASLFALVEPAAGRQLLGLAEEAEVRAEDRRFAQLFVVRDGRVHLGGYGEGFESEATRLYDVVAAGDAGALAVMLMPEWRARMEMRRTAGGSCETPTDVHDQAAGSPEVQDKLRWWRERLDGLEYVVTLGGGASLRTRGVALVLLPWASWPLEGEPWGEFQMLHVGSLYPWQFSGISAGLWSGMRWVRVDGEMQAQVALTGLSRGLREVLEEGFPDHLTARWVWTGLGEPVTRSELLVPGSDPQDMTWLLPGDLRLEIVDPDGELVWSSR